MNWTHRAGDKVQAPIWYSGDYVISCRAEYVLSYRPYQQHYHVGTYASEALAKNAAVNHARTAKAA